MTIDVTQNSQYLSLKQSYDTRITNAQKLEDLTKGSGITGSLKPIAELTDTISNAANKSEEDALDPDGTIRQQLAAGKDPVALLKQQESDALSALSTTLISNEQVANANAAALSGWQHGAQDIMTRAMGVFALLSDATDGVSNNYMDLITGNVDQITSLNGSSQTVRGARPTGKPTDTCTISGAAMDEIKNEGVTLPDGLSADKDGNYTVSQANCDTLLNNIQSQSSSLTTLNQNTTISLNKSIDVGQQCSQFQTSELEKWSQLMSKILS